MARRVFILRSRLGRSIFILREDSLEITSHLFGTKSESRFPIRSISPDYDVRGWRSLGAISLLLVPVALSIVAYRYILHHAWVPEMFAHYPLYFGATYAVAAIKLFPRFEAFVFKNHFNRPIFSILRESGQRAEAEAFIHALLDRIEALGHGEVVTTTASEAAAEEVEAEKSDDRTIARWKLSVGFAVIATAVPPLVNWLWSDWDFLLMPLVIVCSGGSVIAAIYACATKERRRWWAVAAAVVALLPVFFY